MDRTIAGLGECTLRLLRVDKLDEGAGDLKAPMFFGVDVDEGDGVLDEYRRSWDDDLESVTGIARRQELVLVRDDGVADAALKIETRLTRAAVHHNDVSEDLGKTPDDGVFIARIDAEMAPLRGSVESEKIPHGAAAHSDVGREDGNSGAGEIRKIADVFRIAFTDSDDDKRARHHAAVLTFRIVVRDEVGFGEVIEIRLERECGHIGFEAADDRPRLCAASKVRVVYLEAPSRESLVPFDEGGKNRPAIDLAGRGIKAEDETIDLPIGRSFRACGEADRQKSKRGEEGESDGFSHDDATTHSSCQAKKARNSALVWAAI